MIIKKKNKILLLTACYIVPIVIYSQSPIATIYGKILDKEKKPVEEVAVSILGSSQPPVYTDSTGKYEYKIPAGKEITVVFSNISFGQERKTVNLKPGERYEINASLKDAVKNTLRDIEISGNQERDNNLIKLDPKIINYIPSSSGDFNAILFSQPGVASRNELSSSYSVRGGNFDENLVYVNDIEVYRPFLVRSGQQEGLSFVNSDMVSSVLFSAGGFEAKYGDKMSSVLDVQYRKPRQFAATVSGSLLGASVHAEDCSKDHRFTWIFGSRYKTSQYILGSLDTKGDYKPSFVDIQSYMTYDINEKWELGFLTNYGNNKYQLIPQDRLTSFGTVNQAYQLKIYFDGQEIDSYETFTNALSATYKPNEKTKLKFITSAFRTVENEAVDIQGQYYINQLETDLGKPNFGQVISNLGVGTFLDHSRDNLNATVFNFEHKGSVINGNNEFLWGTKYQHELIDYNLSEWKYVDSAGYSLPQNPSSTVNLKNVVKSQDILSSNRLSGYAEQIWRKELQDTSKITLTAGVRTNYWDLNQQLVTSPRVTVSYRPHWKKNILFRASTGYYYQPPFFRELIDLNGAVHTDVKAQQSIHYVLASDLNFKAWDRPFKFVSELYYKQLNDLIPYEVEDVRIRYFPTLISHGYATGIDMKVNGQFVNGLESWFSLSVLQTKAEIENYSYYDYYNSAGQLIIPGYTSNNIKVDSVKHNPGYLPRPTDQRVTLSLFFQDYLPKFPDCKMHLNFIFGTGTPFGPPGNELYKDVLRMPPYFRVDIGFSYQIVKESHKLSKHNSFNYLKSLWASIEVFNLLDINNTVSYLWVTDVTGRQYAVPNYLTARQLNLKLTAKF